MRRVRPFAPLGDLDFQAPYGYHPHSVCPVRGEALPFGSRLNGVTSQRHIRDRSFDTIREVGPFAII